MATHPPTVPSTRSLVVVPALITLAVTALRRAVEFAGLPAWLANNGAGGAGAIFGIVWMPLVFGPWFALRIRDAVASNRAVWRPLAKTLVVYGLLARLPVALLTIPAVLGDWGTHYDKFPFEGGAAAKIAAGFAAQLVFWACIWTVVTGTLAGMTVLAMRGRTRVATV